MRVAIAGAGAVGRSIARELLENGHEVLLIDQKPSAIKVDSVPRAEWLLADACEINSLKNNVRPLNFISLMAIAFRKSQKREIRKLGT